MMTIQEFENQISLQYLKMEFFNPKRRLENILNRTSFKDFASEAYLLFEKNETSIIEDFFKNVRNDLEHRNYSALLKNLSILIFEPFNKSHVIELCQIYRIINSKLKQSDFDSKLLNFYWVLMDHNFHGNIFDKFDIELLEAKKILIENKIISDEKDLILQKIEHHYGL